MHQFILVPSILGNINVFKGRIFVKDFMDEVKNRSRKNDAL